jgi:hypothetical protein
MAWIYPQCEMGRETKYFIFMRELIETPGGIADFLHSTKLPAFLHLFFPFPSLFQHPFPSCVQGNGQKSNCGFGLFYGNLLLI